VFSKTSDPGALTVRTQRGQQRQRRTEMSKPTMRRIIPKELIPPLKILGKYDWLHWESLKTTPPSTSFELRIPNDPDLMQHVEFVVGLHQIPPQRCSILWQFYIASRALAGGPKLLCPTTEQCEALEHVDVNVRFEDYEQPFPVFIVQLPEDYRRKLTDRFQHECPAFVLNLHDKRTGYIISFCEHGFHEGGTFNVMSPRTYRSTVEDALRFSLEHGADLEQGEVLQRVAINFGLLLTRYGTVDRGPIDPVAHQKQSRNSRSSNNRKACRAKELLDATFNLIEFEQEVIFFETVPTNEPNPNADGKKKRPHWRRGHFRRQRCGTGLRKRRLIFIPPVLVNSAYFHGDVADTEYRISSRLDDSEFPRNRPAPPAYLLSTTTTNGGV